ncbi:MAG: alpha/beta hydrolase [Thermomicrobiales bacterium]
MRYAPVTLLILIGVSAMAMGSPLVRAQEATRVELAMANDDIDASIDIGGRALHLVCQGEGAPTVILEAGRFPAAEWAPVFTGVEQVTRVCRYDRANVDGSDPAPLPRTGADVVADLHALLEAAEVRGPYVLVGADLGGLYTRLYAATYPNDVAGMVLVDAVYEEVFTSSALFLTPQDLAETIRIDMTGGDPEGIWTPRDVPKTFAEMRAARQAGPMKPMPLLVLAAGNLAAGADSPYPPASDAVWPPLSLLIQTTLSTLTPDGELVVLPESGHFIHRDQPQAVIDAVTVVVEAVRDPDTWAAATPVP